MVLDEEKDVVLLLHASKGCEDSAHFRVYYKRMAARFQQLNLTSLVIAHMDVADEAPPAHLQLLTGKLPIMVIVTAQAKHPPWSFFSGVGKIATMIKWVHSHVSVPFVLENLPHLSEKDKVV